MEHKPNLLMLTSSFPRGPDDETCGYIRDFARSLAADFDVRALAPPDREAQSWPRDSFTLERSRPFLPLALNQFQASRDFNNLTERHSIIKLGLFFSLASFFLRAFKLARKADVVCSHWMLPCGLIGALLSRMLAKPHIVIEHSGALHLLARMRGGAALARFIARNSERIVTVSFDLKARLIELCPEAAEKIEVIPMGIGQVRAATGASDFESVLPAGWQRDERATRPPKISDREVDARERVILFVGRLTQIKGLAVLLKAMSRLDAMQLIVAGDGDERASLEKLARALSINAKFLGRVRAAERESLLASCDAVVIPSLRLSGGRTEGTPLVCLEAMAAGRAVIASRVGGLAEVISDGRNGLLFEPGDHLTLAAKLGLVLNSESLRAELIANARQTAASYDWSKTGAKFSRVIKFFLEGNDPNACNQRLETGGASG